MADSSSNSSLHRDTLSLRQISYSLFHNSGSRIGVGAKSLPDSESAWSPTSPLDCKLFSNLSNPFSGKSSATSFRTGHEKQLNCSKVGLGIISSLVNETNLKDEILGKSQGKNVIFRPQVKTGIHKFSKKSRESVSSCMKSNSLPKNYVISLASETKNPKSEVESFDDVSGKEEFSCESQASQNIVTSLPDSSKPSSSLINSNHNSNLGINDFCVEDTSTAMSLALVTGRSSQDNNSSKIQSCSLPISIDFSNGYIGSLSARDIELSEDYTCIISHGPNPKRTHIFGDCILECHKNDFSEFSRKEEPVFRSSEVSTFSEGSAAYPSGNVSSFCYSCHKKLEEGEDFYICRGEKAFCSINCQSEEILVQEELEKTCTNSAGSSPGSSYHDLFLTVKFGMTTFLSYLGYGIIAVHYFVAMEFVKQELMLNGLGLRSMGPDHQNLTSIVVQGYLVLKKSCDTLIHMALTSAQVIIVLLATMMYLIVSTEEALQ